MACGKTSVGRELARQLKWRFVDSDLLIESQTQMSIPEIFKKQGETYFREREHQILRQLGRERRCVISLGGGVVENPHNRAILNKGLWIFLRVPFAVLAKRLAMDSTRPLAQKGLSQVEELYRKRLPFYEMAPCQWNCAQLEPSAIARQIAFWLKGFQGK